MCSAEPGPAPRAPPLLRLFIRLSARSSSLHHLPSAAGAAESGSEWELAAESAFKNHWLGIFDWFTSWILERPAPPSGGRPLDLMDADGC